MMNIVWAGMCFVGLAWGLAQGRGAALTEGALTAVMDAVSLSIRLAGGFALWNGMLAILEKSGALRALTRALSPVLRRLFRGVPADSPAQEAMAMNMAANMLGLGNAATPMGLRAMRLLPRGGYLATASCSHFMESENFEYMLKNAAKDANVRLREVEVRKQAPDHPILWNVPETSYLKFYIFQIV